MSRAFWVGIAFAVAAIATRIVASSGRLPWLNAVSIALWVSLAILTFAVLLVLASVGPAMLRGRELRRVDDHALVFTAQRTRELMKALDQVVPTEERGSVELKTYFTVFANDAGIAFWPGSGESRRVALLPWDLIETVTVGEAFLARPLPSLVVVPRAKAAAPPIEFVPCKGGSAQAFAILDPQKTADVARKLLAKRP